jgi:hypothetical protein
MGYMEEYGHDLVQTSAHFGARPEHEVWQGKAFSLSGRKVIDGKAYPDFYQATGYGRIDGMQGVNCRHSWGPHYPGISQLPKVEGTRDGKTSKQYYKAAQKQRGLERQIRDKKRTIALGKEAGLPMTQEKLELGVLQGKLKTFVATEGLVRNPMREKAYGIAAQPRALRSATRHPTRPEGTLGVKIDKFVACLEDRAGNILKTESVRLAAKDLKGFTQRSGWYINWEKEAKAMEVYGLRLAGDTEIQGLISLTDDPENNAVKLGWVSAAPWNQGKLGEKRYSGVGGHMFAIAAQRSVDLGYNGYMWGIAKNETLARHYVNKIGARRIGNSYRITFNEATAKALLEKYAWTKA